MSSEWMSAPECLEAGLVMEVLPDDQLMPQVMEKARKLTAMPLVSLLRTKELMIAPHREQMKAASDAEIQALADLMGGPANLEAVAAF